MDCTVHVRILCRYRAAQSLHAISICSKNTRTTNSYFLFANVIKLHSKNMWKELLISPQFPVECPQWSLMTLSQTDDHANNASIHFVCGWWTRWGNNNGHLAIKCKHIIVVCLAGPSPHSTRGLRWWPWLCSNFVDCQQWPRFVFGHNRHQPHFNLNIRSLFRHVQNV